MKYEFQMKTQAKTQRNRKLIEMKRKYPRLNNGALAIIFGISRNRVWQILKREERREREQNSNKRIAGIIGESNDLNEESDACSGVAF